jgi:copper homeostasis protein (lipoprotein)
MIRRSLFAVLLACASTACGRHADDGAAAITPAPPNVVGVYEGRLPCSNCSTIATTIWLRADDVFFLRQRYLNADDQAVSENVTLGRWRWDERAAQLVLAGAGPERRLAPLDADRWRLKSVSAAEQLVTRAAAAIAAPDRFRLDGLTQVVEPGAPFAECVTGRQWPLAEGRGFKELRRQQRLVNGHANPARASIEAHLTTAPDGDPAREALVVDRFVTLRPGVGC